jgi:hypothetical protein
MTKLRKALASLSHSLGIQQALRDRAVGRMKARHAGQKKAERQATAAREAAARLRKEAHHFLTFGPKVDQAKGERKLRRAERKGAKALRYDAKAEKEKARAVVWRGRARKLSNRIEGVETRIDKVKAELRKLGSVVKGNRVEGGDEFERWRTCLLASVHNCATADRRNEYSMGGDWDIDHEIVGGPAPGNRSDCSSTVTGWSKACGFPDPNGQEYNGGFTGTLLTASGRWKQVSLEHMLKARRPAFIVYGYGNGHHTEAWCPAIADNGDFIDAMRTAGHGSDPVDFGTVHLFGSGEVERYFILAAE